MPNSFTDYSALAIMAVFAMTLLKIVQSVLAYYETKLSEALERIVHVLDLLEERTRACVRKEK